MSQLTITKETFNVIQKPFIKQLDEVTFNREVSFAIQLVSKSDILQKCTQESLLSSVLNISQTGLTLNPVLNYAYLVPRYNSKTKQFEAHLDPGYQGLSKLATDTGSVESIEVQLIYEGDEIEIDLASAEKVKKHIPYILTGKEKGEIRGGYSLAVLPSGRRHFELMGINDILSIRDYSESYKAFKNKKVFTSTWDEKSPAYPEMLRKTILKRHFKYMPKSEVPEQLQNAIELSNQDFDFPMSYNQAELINSLLLNSAIPEEREREIYQAISGATETTQKEAGEIIEYLKENQLDPVRSGNAHYTQGDIKKTLRDNIS